MTQTHNRTQQPPVVDLHDWEALKALKQRADNIGGDIKELLMSAALDALELENPEGSHLRENTHTLRYLWDFACAIDEYPCG